MHSINGLVFICILSASVMSFEAKLYDNDESDWLDPNDLIDYDPVTKTMRSRQNLMNTRDSEASERPGEVVQREKLQVQSVELGVVNVENNDLVYKQENESFSKCQSEASELRVELDRCNATVSDLKKQAARCKALRDQAFFRQYVSVLLDQFKNFETTHNGHYEVDLKMTTEQYAYLQKYSIDEQASTQEVHSILRTMYYDSRWKTSDSFETDYSSEFWSLFLLHGMPLVQIICAVCLSLVVCIRCFQSRLWTIKRLVFLLFVMSFLWTWFYIYKKECAAHRAALHKAMPDSCRAEQQSLFSWIASFVSIQTDECATYYEKLIDPIWAVPPTKALAVTVTKFLVEPLEHIGEALNKLIKAAFTGLPFYHYITVFLLIIILMVLGILVGARYRIRTPFFNIEPHRPTDERLTQRLAELEDEKTQRLAELEDENKRLHQSVESQKQMIRSNKIALIEVASESLGKAQTLRQLQLPQGTLPDRQHQQSMVQKHAVTGRHGEGDGLLESEIVIETLAANTTDTVSRHSPPTGAEADFVIIKQNSFHQWNQPPIVQRDALTITDTACQRDQVTVNKTETGFTSDIAWQGHQPAMCEGEFVIINGIKEVDAVFTNHSVCHVDQLGFRETDAVISGDTLSQVDQLGFRETDAVISGDTLSQVDQLGFRETDAVISGDTLSQVDRRALSEIGAITTHESVCSKNNQLKVSKANICGNSVCQDYQPTVSETDNSNTGQGHSPAVFETNSVSVSGDNVNQDYQPAVSETDNSNTGPGHSPAVFETNSVSVSGDIVNQDYQPAVSETDNSNTGQGHSPAVFETNSVSVSGDNVNQDHRPVVSDSGAVVISGDFEQAVSRALETSVGNSDTTS